MHLSIYLSHNLFIHSPTGRHLAIVTMLHAAMDITEYAFVGKSALNSFGIHLGVDCGVIG
jgi:hypothetical protein